MDPRPGMEIGAAGEGLRLSGKCPHNQAWLCCRQKQEKEEEEEEEGTCLTAAGQWSLLEAPSLREGGHLPAPLLQPVPGALVRERGPAGGRRAQSCRGEGQDRDGILSAPALRGWGIGSCGARGDGALPEGGRGYRREGEAAANGSGATRNGVRGYAGKGL